MTNQTVPLEQVEVIGYADTLPNGNGPAVLPPVFRDRQDPCRCFLPPFRISGRWLLDPKVVSSSEVEDLAKAERLTLPEGFKHPARTDSLLWVGLEGTVHYEPASEARRNLRNLCREEIEAASAALRNGDIEAAERHAGTALAADDWNLEPEALLAACHAVRGEESQVAFLRSAVAMAGHCPETFDLLLKNYLELVPAKRCFTSAPPAR